MFAIYDTRGRRFRDTLENLRKVQAQNASENIQLRNNVTEDETPPIPTPNDRDKAEISNKALQSYRDILQLNQREPIYHAHQLMSHPVTTVSMELDILSARRFFQQQKFQQMPVINAQEKIIGMLSIEDLLQFIIIDGEQVRYTRGKKVSDAMSQQVITADPVSDIRRIAQVMQEYHLSGVPIVNEQDRLIGIVSRSDILRAVTNDPPLNMWS
ncbi:MAG: CBS domain-containing protein [Gammaproteobacteria bacterium]|nr:CBS domain-containing protein [Gammaproteobacteria bacterium]